MEITKRTEIEPGVFVSHDRRIWFCNDNNHTEDWPKWKNVEECNAEELKKANLAQIELNDVELDIETKDNYEEICGRLKLFGYHFSAVDTQSRGIHYKLKFKDLENYSFEDRTRIRRYFILQFKADLKKASDNTIISIPGRPHFKSLKNAILLLKDDTLNTLPKEAIQYAEDQKKVDIEFNLKNDKLNVDSNFADFFEKDPFFLYLTNLKEPLKEGMSRNDTLLKNLAIASVKSGKSADEIKKITFPLLKRIMPDVTYKQFQSWAMKAVKGELKNYGFYELNNWAKLYKEDKQEFYDLTPIKIDKTLLMFDNNEEKILISDNELASLDLKPKEYLVDNLIPARGITLLAGKRASFKTFMSMYLAETISRGVPVFNGLRTSKVNVLYIDEENGETTAKERTMAIKKHLNLSDNDVGLYWIIQKGFIFNDQKWFERLDKIIQEKNISLVIADTIPRTTKMENSFSGDEVTALYQDCFKPLIVKYNLAFLFLLHMRKGGGNYKPTDRLDEVKNSGEWTNIAENVITVEKDSNSNNKFIVYLDKTRDQPIEPMTIEINSKMTEVIYKIQSGEEIKRKRVDEVEFKVLEGALASIDDEVKCAEIIKNWIVKENKEVFRTKDSQVVAESAGFGKNTMYAAIAILKAKNIIDNPKKGLYYKKSKNIALDKFIGEINDEDNTEKEVTKITK